MIKKLWQKIEPLILIVIICALITVLLVAFNTVRTKERDVRRKANTDLLANSLELFFDTTGGGGGVGHYPSLGDWQDENQTKLTDKSADKQGRDNDYLAIGAIRVLAYAQALTETLIVPGGRVQTVRYWSSTDAAEAPQNQARVVEKAQAASFYHSLEMGGSYVAGSNR